MQVELLFIKIKERLNKLDSADYDNIQCWQVREAFNKAQLEWIRTQIDGKNDSRAGDEETQFKVDDLQVLLKPVTLKGKNLKDYFESEKLPTDYLYFKRVTPLVNKGTCSGVRIKSNLREEANVGDYLDDWSLQPSFEFEQTFHTLVGNKIRVYTNDDFEVNELNLIYYRYPREIDFASCARLDGQKSKNTDPEFKDDMVEVIIDSTASILAGDVESINQVSLTKQRSYTNT